MCIDCDASMMMKLQELQSSVHHQLPIKHTLNSGASCQDFSKLANGFDISCQICHWHDVDAAQEKVQAATGSIICEVFIHPEQLFSPKLSVMAKEEVSLVSPSRKDLSPLSPLYELDSGMLQGMHEKYKTFGV